MNLTKTFRNTAPQPIQISATITYREDGIVTNLVASGGQVGLDDDQQAEVHRMYNLLMFKFIGRHFLHFAEHDGVIATGSPLLKDDGRRYVILNDVDAQNVAEAMLTKGGILDLLFGRGNRPPRDVEKEIKLDFGIDVSNMKADISRIVQGWVKDVPVREFNPSIYTKDYDAERTGPIPGTYWQSRTEPLHFYKLTSAVACVGHWHVEMHRLLDGEPNDRVWFNEKQWSDFFTQVDRATALAPLSPQSSVGPHGLRRLRKSFLPPEAFDMSAFLRPPVRPSDAEPPASVVDATQRVLDGVEFTGTEAPPKLGEKYQRVDGKQVWTVIGVTQEDFGVHRITLDSGDDGRIKVEFRNHAQWLAHWRPADSEGNAKEVVFVDIENDDKEAFAEVREGILHEDGVAVRWIRIIGRELDRRLPGWRDYDPPGVLYDDCALILRAIRTLNRRGVEAESHLEAHRAALKDVEDLAERRSQKIEKLEFQMKEMTRDASMMFKEVYGMKRLQEVLAGAGYASVVEVMPRDQQAWVSTLRKHMNSELP